jgi:hypothetical protein
LPKVAWDTNAACGVAIFFIAMKINQRELEHITCAEVAFRFSTNACSECEYGDGKLRLANLGKCRTRSQETVPSGGSLSYRSVTHFRTDRPFFDVSIAAVSGFGFALRFCSHSRRRGCADVGIALRFPHLQPAFSRNSSGVM